MTDKLQPDQPEADRPELEDPLNTALESDAAVDVEAESAAAASDTFEQSGDELPEADLDISEISDEGDKEPDPEPQLERLQKILAKSGIASRRHAEELITSGRVQVNGKVITEMGSKADPARDHIRVDGKLLQGSERHRYFMLNKPKGYVTTVSDPEGRPTIMEFFSKTRERLYPVGRLDYLSEGLLLVTNDGELANKLTRAASNVEKTYLVKISGEPSEEALERLRQGVGIAKGKAGSDRVQTAPAEIRPFRPGKPAGKKGPSSRPVDNPWYEVVLIEGRNRELRKMFEEIGHHVEKIRRVGYGPLVLDLEPGKIRELEPEEVENLRKAAEGKYRKPKSREPRTREFKPRSDRPTSKPRWNENRPGAERPRSAGVRREFGAREERRPFRSNERGPQQRPQSFGTRRPERDQFPREPRRESGRGEPRREFRPGGSRPNPRFAEDRPQRPARPDQSGGSARPPFRGRPENRKVFGDRPQRPFQREGQPKSFASRPPRRAAPPSFKTERPEGRRFDSASPERSATSRPFRPERSSDRLTRRDDRPRFDRPRSGEERPQSRPPRPDRNDRPTLDIRPVDDRDSRERDEKRPSRSGRPPFRDNPRPNQRTFERPRREAPSGQKSETRPERPSRPAAGQRSSSSRPAGSFKGGKRPTPGGKRSAPGGDKPGSARSSSGRRPGGNRPKRKP